MATKTLTITEEAYDRLRSHKRSGESFTETILRITDPEGDPMAGFGAMSDVDGFRDAVEDTRGALDGDLRERRERDRRHRRGDHDRDWPHDQDADHDGDRSGHGFDG